MPQRLRIGTRGSQLALWQAHHVAAELGDDHEIIVIKTAGDRLQNAPLTATSSTIGLFTKEIEQALLAKQIDIAVHSYKDLPLVQPDGLEIAAVPPRGPVADVLVTRQNCITVDSHWGLVNHATVGTGSPRRRAQLMAKRPDLQLTDLRGNITSRIERIYRGELDAVILAAAGIIRLDLKNAIANKNGVIISLPIDEFCPAPAQGALAIQIRTDDTLTRASVSRLHHFETAAAVSTERALLARLGGGCQLPLGAHCTIENNGVHLRATVANPDSTHCYSAKASCATASEAVKQVYAALCAAGAPY